MILKRIKYHNFRPFIGDQEINLEINDYNKNVIVLLGDNTRGKSTFVSSFVWCLYGEDRFNKKDSLLNEKVLNNMSDGDTESVYVEIEFEDGAGDEKKIYLIRREKIYQKGVQGISKLDRVSLSYEDKDGKTKPVKDNDIKNVINAILPSDLSAFIFFEGEKDNEVQKKDLGDAVRTLLGLAAFTNMKKHLYGPPESNKFRSDSVLGKLQAELANLGSSEELSRLLKKKETWEEELSNYNEDLNIHSNSIKEIEQKKTKLEEELRAAEPSKKLQIQRENLNAKLNRDKENHNKKLNDLVRLFGRKSLFLFIYPLLSKAQDRLEAMNIADKGIKGIDAQALDELLNRGKCLCGTDLRDGSMAYNEIKKYYEILPPKAVGTLVAELEDAMAASVEERNSFMENFDNLYKDILNLSQSINDTQKEIDYISDELKRVSDIDVKTLETYRNDCEVNLKQLRDKESIAKANIIAKGKDIEKISDEIAKFQLKIVKADKHKLYFEYAQAVYEWLDKEYSRKEKAILARLNKNV